MGAHEGLSSFLLMFCLHVVRFVCFASPSQPVFCPPSLVHDNFPDIVWRRGIFTLALSLTFVFACLEEFCFVVVSSSVLGKGTHYHRLIGVFWLRPGNDWLDVILVGGVGAEFCGVLRCGARFHPLDDHCRVVLPRSSPCCHVHCRTHQLDGQFPCWHRLPNNEGTV